MFVVDADTPHQSMIALICPQCASPLPESGVPLLCATCGASYPVRNGIPYLVDHDFYWGEIQQADAQRLIDEARRVGWRTAVANRFTPADDAWISILDWQRASWIPLLELPSDAAVLDIGSGYGAITHALAQHFEEVHSIDAIPQRVEFTSLRMRQEGFTNVRLAVGSALRLPYPPNSFDAIVVNGVLEWIGDWDPEGSPRDAQLRFLRRVQSLLKPNGRLLVGIENRLSYASFYGAIDHSGLPFTNLLPRPLATAALKLFARQHHRMVAPSKTYRTYTYTRAGYDKLFSEAGFYGNDGYWSEPGYNQPYRLTPLDKKSIERSLDECQFGARSEPGGLSAMARLKRLFARFGLFRHFVLDFVFIVHKSEPEPHAWETMLPPELKPRPHFLLTTYPFAKKTTIRAYLDDDPGVVVKVSTPTVDSCARVANEFAELQRVSEIASRSPELLPFEVARPLASETFGRQLITVESRAVGEPLSMILPQLDFDRQVAFLRRHLGRLAESTSAVSRLGPYRARRTSAATWLRNARTVLGANLASRIDDIGGKYDTWMGHGDFTVENCVLDVASGRLTLIDWEFVRDGVPPMYDLFCLYFSILNFIQPPDDILTRCGDDLQLAQFHTVLFADNALAKLFREQLSREFARLAIDPGTAYDLLLDSLLFRIGYLVERRSGVAQSRIRFVNVMDAWRESFRVDGVTAG